MKNTLSLKRLVLLSKIHISSFLTAFAGGIAIMLLIVFYISAVAGHDTDNYVLFFPFIYIFTGCVYTSAFYGSWVNKGKAFSFFTIPASVSEKFLIGMFFTTILFSILFPGLYFASAYVLGNIFHPSFSLMDLMFGTSTDIRLERFSYEMCFLNYIILQSVFLLGSIFFNRRQFNFSAISVFVLIMIFIPGKMYMLKMLTGLQIYSSDSMIWMDGHLIIFGGNHERITMSAPVIIASFAFWILIPVMVYYTAFLKLKEKEI